MDPQAAWSAFLAAYVANDLDEAKELAESIDAWLNRGGFPPQCIPGVVLDDSMNQALARAACRAVLQMC
jgi:hypothetical protein